MKGKETLTFKKKSHNEKEECFGFKDEIYSVLYSKGWLHNNALLALSISGLIRLNVIY